jgi:hypothetical protein
MGERDPLTDSKCTTGRRRVRRFRRLRALLRGDFREAFAPAPEPPPEPPPDLPRTRAPMRGWVDERDKPLPPGWKFEALYYRGTGMKPNPDPTDDEIAGADAIIVSYTDALGKDYRTIHRADSRRKVGTLIATVTMPESPPR